MVLKKNFLSAYEPPRLVKGRDRWYISFYAADDLDGGRRKHYRPTFNLNRIHNIKERESRANDLVAKIGIWLDAGKPISKFEEQKVRITGVLTEDYSLLNTPVKQALDHILAIKAMLKPDSQRSFISISKMFLLFLEKKKWDRLSIGELGKTHARAYLDDCLIVRKLSPITWNNQVAVLRTMFNELLERGYVERNPFQGIKKKKNLPKKRRPFTQDEARVVMKRIRERPLLFYTVLILYCCFLRPKEIRSLRFKQFDLKRGLIYLSYKHAKDNDNRVVTIPSDFLPYFDVQFFSKYPAESHVFGEDFQPGKAKSCGHNIMYRQHLKVLEELHREGKLRDIEGLTLYSWKDTGITEALEYLPLLSVQDQAGHSKPEMTMKYRHKSEVNEKFKGFENKILP